MIYPGRLNATHLVAGCVAIYENAFPDPDKVIQIVEQEVLKPDSMATGW